RSAITPFESSRISLEKINRDRCFGTPRNPFLVCALHLTEPDSNRCLYFRPSWLVKLEFGAPNSKGRSHSRFPTPC
ncbi:MAG: hypothetical protein AB1589_36855, partial [Cyanobacteriota bacterium]